MTVLRHNGIYKTTSVKIKKEFKKFEKKKVGEQNEKNSNK